MMILVATLVAACSTPYGGPGGCLVVGKGSCYTDGQNAPAPKQIPVPRYASQRNWPAANFLLDTFPLPITGSSLTLSTGGGPLLVIFHANIANDALGASVIRLEANLDGTIIPNATVEAKLAPALTTHLTSLALIEAAAGAHALEVTGRSDTGSGEKVIPTSGNLIVIELPLWTTEDTIE